jgi:hypothetical protein
VIRRQLYASFPWYDLREMQTATDALFASTPLTRTGSFIPF